MTCLPKEAITALNQALRLPATGREQDWEIELANPDRVNDFVDYAENHALSGGEKHALMALILGSLEDLAHRKEVPSAVWNRVARLLRAEPGLHAGLVEQWGPRNDGLDGFAISPLLQSL